MHLKRIMILTAALGVFALVVSAKVWFIMNDERVSQATLTRGSYTVKSPLSGGIIYDMNGTPLVNESVKYEAVVNPADLNAVRLLPYIKDYDKFGEGLKGTLPFLCEVTSETAAKEAEIEGFTVLKSPVRYGGENGREQLAPHIIGYISDGKGVSGIEKAFDDYLRGDNKESVIKYSVNAVGGVLGGLDANVEIAEPSQKGVVLTIDSNIQKIVQDVMRNSDYKKGAVVIMDVHSGDVLACVSMPDFDNANVGEYMQSGDANFVNRAFSAYSVGSVFKLVTAATALEIGISPEYTHNCIGYTKIGDVTFNCHKWGGHGEINMQEAIRESCNTYFIELSEFIKREKFVGTASELGFGKGFTLCDSIFSDKGYLQTPTELAVKAERANLSFGQGKLTATPLQVCRMTCSIANGGILPEPKLIKGFLDNNGVFTEYNSNPPVENRVLQETTTQTLRLFMEQTIMKNSSLARPLKTTAGGKTSTAQTGLFKTIGEGYDDEEIMNCWFTGFFPVDEPKYAVTILIEDGYSGNYSAAPIFREIADAVAE